MTDIATIKASQEYKRLKALLSDREWRLDNLYYIRDEDGNTVKFVRNEAQRAFSSEMWSRDLIPKARKLGFSTFIAVYVCDGCVFRSGTVAGIVDRSLDDACDKLGMVKFAYDHLPQNIRDAQPLVRQNAHELAWGNGSTVTVGTTYRGGTPTILHISEYGKISVDSPETAREIKTGAIQSVPATGKIFVESTAHGNSGAFCDMVKSAEAKKQQKSELTQLDFKLHFYGWWKKREYRLPNNLVIIPQELKAYFAELQAKHSIKLDADQMAWYAKKHEELGPDDIKQEFPSCVIGSTLVATPSGLVPISEIEPDGKVILKKFNQGEKPVFRLKTSLGYEIEATADHLFRQSDGNFVELQRLTIGDEISLQSEPSFGSDEQIIKYSIVPFAETSIAITERIAEFIGIYMGDGSFSDGNISIACDAQDEDLVRHASILVSEVTGGDPYIRKIGRLGGCSEIRISRKSLIEPFRAMGIVRQNGSNKSGGFKRNICVPDFIKRSPQRIVAAFLRGLFEADGFAHRNGAGVKFFGKDESFVKDIQLLLLQFGITSKRNGIVKDARGKTYRGCELCLRTEEAIKYSELIGFISARKQARIRSAVTRRLIPKKRSRPASPIKFSDRIVSINPIGMAHVYDIMTNTGQFSGNGVVVHNCTDELFYASLEGAYWKKELTKARQEGRIGQLVPHDPTRRVNTFWDIGEDCTAILFHQTDGVRHRFVDYYEEEGGSLQAAAGILRDKERERGFSYDKHYGPHDLENRDWAAKAKTRVDTAKDLGLTFTVVPRIGDKADSIDAARRMIGLSWFDAEHCSRLVECLDNYRKKWNDRLGVFLSDPVHDWACHAADAIQQGAMGLVPDKPSKEGRHRLHDTPRSSQWAA